MRKRKLNAQNEALAVWRALEPQIVEAVRRETADCLRQKKLTVVTAPNGTTMGVMQPNDSTISVSYTHLDVYKRQSQWRYINRPIFSRLPSRAWVAAWWM